MSITVHAKDRMRLRCITDDDVDLILEHGASIQRPGDATEMFISQHHLPALIKNYRKKVATLENIQNKAVLVANDGTIITVYRKN